MESNYEAKIVRKQIVWVPAKGTAQDKWYKIEAAKSAGTEIYHSVKYST